MAEHCVGIRDALHAGRPCWQAKSKAKRRRDVIQLPGGDYENKSAPFFAVTF